MPGAMAWVTKNCCLRLIAMVRSQEFGGDVLPGVASVVTGVVDEHVDRLEAGEDRLEGFVEGGGIGEVAGKVRGWGSALFLQAVGEGVGGFVLDIEKDDLCGLRGECFDELFADASGTAGDEHGAARRLGYEANCGLGSSGLGLLGLGSSSSRRRGAQRSTFFILEGDYGDRVNTVFTVRRPA